MNARARAAVVAALVAPVWLAASEASAAEALRATLSGYHEVPTLSVPGGGEFRGQIVGDDEAIDYELSYADTTSRVLQAHLHLGAPGVNGGIIIFLCSNLGNGPAGTPECPPAPATVSGTLTPDGIVGPANQGIAPGEWEELIAAIRAGAVYANVHTEQFTPGEIRGQVSGSSRQSNGR